MPEHFNAGNSLSEQALRGEERTYVMGGVISRLGWLPALVAVSVVAHCASYAGIA